jgi:hypothetical protein
MTQNQQILDHLRTGKDITPLQALGLYGVYRLAARINDLRKQDVPIETVIRTDGQGRTYASYKMENV